MRVLNVDLVEIELSLLRKLYANLWPRVYQEAMVVPPCKISLGGPAHANCSSARMARNVTGTMPSWSRSHAYFK